MYRLWFFSVEIKRDNTLAEFLAQPRVSVQWSCSECGCYLEMVTNSNKRIDLTEVFTASQDNLDVGWDTRSQHARAGPEVNLRRRWKYRRCTMEKWSHVLCWWRPRSEQWSSQAPDVQEKRFLKGYCSNGKLVVPVQRWSRRGKTCRMFCQLF